MDTNSCEVLVVEIQPPKTAMLWKHRFQFIYTSAEKKNNYAIIISSSFLHIFSYLLERKNVWKL